MKNSIKLSCIFFVLIVAVIKAETINISGTYLDKKSNPIAIANVGYYLYGNSLAASTISAASGYFSFQITITGINSGEAGSQEFRLSQNQPNPFSANTWFNAIIPESGTLSVYSITGKEIARIDLVNAGCYHIKWGGLDQRGNIIATGIYLYSLCSAGKIISNKMAVINGYGAGSGLEVLSYSNNQNSIKNSENLLTDDILRFTKTNTSLLDLIFPTPSGDTILNNVIGNVGPNSIGSLTTTVNINNLPQWNLNQFFYNDDQSIYELNDTVNFHIVSDSLLMFIGTNPGQYYPQITAIDPMEGTLTAVMTANITVSNQQVITITGIYLDKLSNPISVANVFYYQQGTILLGQTITSATGSFTLSLTTTGTTLDTIKFQKVNTSLKKIGFHTPQADTNLSTITGNIGPVNTGTISETHYTIESTVQWSLNNYFTNDDQNNYTVSAPHYAISGTNLVFTVPAAGSYPATVTATDPQDPSLTAIMSAINTVLATMVIPDFTIREDTTIGVIIPNLNVYKNPGYSGTLTYSVFSNSNPTLLQVSINGSALSITYLQPDGTGVCNVGVKMVNGSLADTCYFNINVQPRSDVSGYVKDIFTNAVIASAKVRFDFNNFHDSVYTNTSGCYKIQLPLINSISYIEAKISKASYTTFHTWVTKSNNTDSIKDFNLIPLTSPSWSWELYNEGFRLYTFYWPLPPYNLALTTTRWLIPPIQDIFSDNSLVGGQNIIPNFNNCITNLQTILPTFDPLEALPVNIVQHTSFSGYTLAPGHMAIYWDNSIPGVGVIGCNYGSGNIQERCEVRFQPTVGGNSGSNTGPNNWVYNQELGSSMGVPIEPPYTTSFISVFQDPLMSPVYTPYDFSGSTVRLGRAKVHYQNSTYGTTDPEGYDWDMRPDLVAQWYLMTRNINNTEKRTFRVKIINFDGTVESISYNYDDIPASVMKQFRLTFSKEEIEKQEKKEYHNVVK